MKKANNNNRNILFIIVSVIVGVFIISPLLLRVPCIRIMFSWLLQPLGNSNYKSSYIETFGAILGTFLAVAGTLWTQRKIDEATAKKESEESALIVYYDFKFAFNDITTFMKSYFSQQGKITNVINDFEEYKNLKKNYRIYIDNDWIHNVAKLSSALSSDEIQLIYKLYGDLNTIKKVFNTPENEVFENEEKYAYSIMFHVVCNIEAELKHQFHPDITFKNNIKVVMNRLRKIGKISEIDDLYSIDI